MQDTLQCGCGRSIPAERAELGFKCCVVCGERFAQSKKRFGYMVYGHKTAGAILVTSQAGFQNYKAVSSRRSKCSNMGSASKIGTLFSSIG